MKIHPPLLSLLIFAHCTTSQKETTTTAVTRNNEFTIYENGLIYDDATMSSLTKLVDSLSLRFKSCTPKTYYSLEQGYGTYFYLEEKHKRKAEKAIANGITLDDFKKLFPRVEKTDSIWIVKSRYTDDGKPLIRYESDGEEHLDVEVPDTIQFDRTQGWIYEETDERIDIFFLHQLKSTIIPPEYGSLIQYVDCMIDTTAGIFPSVEKRIWPDPNFKSYPRLKAFLDMANSFEPEPTEPGDDRLYQKYDSTYKVWRERRLVVLDEKMKDPENVRIFNEAMQEVIDAQSGWWFPEFGERYLTGSKLLEYKRSYRVHGYCSMDTGPRDHAVSICMLAAECRQWDIFLRAHLDILNDNFSRSSDAVNAWRGRGTYLKEIEELDINSVDLLVGTLLNAKEVSTNHYQASTSRVGRAMSESKNKTEFEDLVLQMICDDRLDLYNRMEMATTLLTYNHYVSDEDTYRNNLERIRDAVEKLPDGMGERFQNWWGTD